MMHSSRSASEPSRHPNGREGSKGSGGFILIFSILMLLGVSTLAVGMVYNAHHGQVAAQNYKNRIRAFCASDGLRTLLAQEVIDGNVGRYINLSLAGEIQGKVWNGNFATIAALKTFAATKTPNRTMTSTYLGSNWKDVFNYGVRWRGYVIPPASGAYTFLVRADDRAEFYLSTDDMPANLSPTPNASVTAWSPTWPTAGTGISNAVSLKIGKRYYFEFYLAQDGGAGTGQVGWRGPNYMTELPIPGKRLAAFGSTAEKWDTTLVGIGKVKYALSEAGPLVYTLNTEAIMGGKGDTTFRSPLNQTLSMRGDNPAPPARLWQRVIYYDFHANGSNPDFNRGAAGFGVGGVFTDMVQRHGLAYTKVNADYFMLDSIGKPRLGTNPRYNCGIDKWFKEWEKDWKKTYNYVAGPASCVESNTADGSDRAFHNMMIKDSLEFVRRPDLGTNAYQFKRFGAASVAAFMPLDGRGVGNENLADNNGVPRNYSFCMELHSKFEHTSGITFDFNGDDDVWLYINDSLVMDLGFVHVSKTATVNLDDLPLTFGETYPLDFFYCERERPGSSIDLITNLPVLQKAVKPSSSWKRDYGNLQ